jgi:hypothetical protein
VNAKQREILTDCYDSYLRCISRVDAVGFMTDAEDLFSSIRKTDRKLDELLTEVYDAWEG